MIKKWLKIKKTLFPNLFTSNNMLKWLQIHDIPVGIGTTFYAPGKTTIDISRPCLLKIGEYCKITEDVIILTHDYSRSVLRRVYGEILGEGRQTIIGDNVFIGMRAIVLMGTQIGSNVIVGAGSVVSGRIPDNVVIAGNPARVIRTLDEHHVIREKKTLEEGLNYVKLFSEFYHRMPTIKELDPFYPLFLERNMEVVEANKLTIRLGGDNYDEIVAKFLQSKQKFDGYEAFLEACDLKR